MHELRAAHGHSRPLRRNLDPEVGQAFDHGPDDPHELPELGEDVRRMVVTLGGEEGMDLRTLSPEQAPAPQSRAFAGSPVAQRTMTPDSVTGPFASLCPMAGRAPLRPFR